MARSKLKAYYFAMLKYIATKLPEHLLVVAALELHYRELDTANAATGLVC